MTTKCASIQMELNSFLTTVIKKAINDEIAENGMWQVGCDSSNKLYGWLSSAIVERFRFQVSDVKQLEESDDFEVSLEFVGDVQKKLNDANVLATVSLKVSNSSGDDVDTLASAYSVDRAIYDIEIQVLTQAGVAELDNLLNILRKSYLFAMIA